MGQPVSSPRKFNLDELHDLSINEQKQQNQGCGPKALGTWTSALKNKGFGWPDNGEFDWGDWGSDCTMCAGVTEYGIECDSGVIGARPQVKRVAFRGDRDGCCWANVKGKDSSKTKDGKTCEPKFRDPNGTECINVYRPYCEDGSRIVNDESCISLQSSNQSLYNTLMKNFCNRSNDNARHSKCIDWCKNNNSQCTQLNLLSDCTKYGLTDDLCTNQQVVDIQAQCKKYGLESEQGLRQYGCNPNAIITFEKECKDYNVNLDACTPISLQDAKVNKINQQTLQLQQSAIQQSQQNFETTRQVITDVLYKDDTVHSTDFLTDISTDNSTIIIIIVSLVFLFLLSSSSLLLLS